MLEKGLNGIRNLAKNAKHYSQREIIGQISKIIPRISDRNLILLTYLAERLAINKDTKAAIRAVRAAWQKKHPSVQLAKDLARGKLSKSCLDKLIRNLMINAFLIGNDKRQEYAKKEGMQPPFLIVISPSMRCNLKCIGCYAAEYSKDDDLSIEIVDRVLDEVKEMGIYFITVSGGEPFLRKEHLDIFEKHNDMYFLVYTNGTLIDRKMAEKLAELGNVAPGISVEGFEKETDQRRGEGTFKKVMQAMDNLKNAGVLFGFSATPTRYNSEVLVSDEFIDFYLKKGCSFGWYFQYIPIGRSPNTSLMATPKQRIKLGKKVDKIRRTKPIFLGDFWNDGPYVGGCMAGGRAYLHITCKGDIEPCVFTHFAVDNIKEKTLREALSSPFFKAIRRKLKTIKDYRAPCTIIDHPEILREACKAGNAYPTHGGAETIIKDEKITEHLDKYSRKIQELIKKD
ncbi:radical SAM protein [bacterium (Candidatus Torokbacteria) CG_4_10_14_0_2_um_filter_35_8]|nr:MAG: radical SAM protein [bacterium (Candidatus Torokbacteria) CG_4_10_14_0_2_um_filter_35_8]